MSKAEDFIKEHTRKNSNLYEKGDFKILNTPWLTPEDALKAVEIAREEVIKKAMAFVNSKFYFNNLHYSIENNSYNCIEEFFDDLKKAMEENI